MEPKIKTQLRKIKVNADEIRIKHQIVTHMYSSQPNKQMFKNIKIFKL